MAGIKISELPPATLPLVGTEVLELEDASGDSVQAAVNDISAALGLDASFVTVTPNAILPNERILTGGVGITIVDGGAGAAVTVDLDDPILLSAGAVGAPSYSFLANPTDGVFNVGTGILGLAADGFLVAQVDGSNGAGNRQFIILPGVTQNNATFPSLAWGDGNTGIFEPSDNQLGITLAGVQRWFLADDRFGSILGGGPAIVNETVSGTNPGFIPDRGTLSTGLGANSAGEPSLIGLGVELARGVTAATGGLFANNLATGGGLERVLTTSDISVAPVTSVFGRVGAVVAIEADYSAFYLVKGAFAAQTVTGDVTFDGSIEFTDVNGVEFGPSVEIDMRNPADDTTFFMQYIAAGPQWGLAGADFNSVFMDFGSSFTHFRFGDPILMTERAAAVGSVAGLGQFWVRNDVPNVPVFTDDAGTDHDLLAGGAGGTLPAGTVVNSGLKWDGVSAWVEETQIALVGGASGIEVRDATLADFIRMGHNGVTAGFAVNAATTEVIFGQGGGPSLAWRFSQTVRVPDGSIAAPGLTWFGDIATGISRGALGLSVSITGVQQLLISNATTQVFSDDLRIINGADFIRWQVDPPGDAGDFVATLTSMTDYHIRGTGLERFVLEELNLAMMEKAAAPGDVAGIGQYWIRDDVPNTAMFTNDAGVDKSLVNDAVQARRTTDYTITTAFADVTLDTTDVETDSAVLNHDLAGSTDNIIVGQPGTYEVTYGADIDPSASGLNNIRAFGRVRINDAGVDIPGSLASTGSAADSSIDGDDLFSRLQCSFIVTLAATDFLTLQLMKVEIDGSGTFTAEEVTVTAKRLL